MRLKGTENVTVQEQNCPAETGTLPKSHHSGLTSTKAERVFVCSLSTLNMSTLKQYIWYSDLAEQQHSKLQFYIKVKNGDMAGFSHPSSQVRKCSRTQADENTQDVVTYPAFTLLKTPPVLLHPLYLNHLQANLESFSSKFPVLPSLPRDIFAPWQIS